MICLTYSYGHSRDKQINNWKYQKAVSKAKYPTASKIDTDLFAIQSDSVSVVKWIRSQDAHYYQNPKDTYQCNNDHYVWVTADAELKNRLKQELSNTKDTILRIEQLLGLPPKSGYNSFVIFKVASKDLFRPCPDEEINDRQCDVHFPDNTKPDHLYWMITNREDKYLNIDPMRNYPWTQLGYTYDWSDSSKTHFGLSEFVIRDRSVVRVIKILSTTDYLAGK